MALTEIIRSYADAHESQGTFKQKYTAVTLGSVENITAVTAKQIQIMQIVLSVDTTGIYQLRTGTDVITSFILAANSCASLIAGDAERPLFCGNVGKNININTTANPTNAGCYIVWRER